MKNISKILTILALTVLMTGQIQADGERICTTTYGGGTVCEEEQPTEEIPVVSTGVADNMLVAGLMSVAGYGLYVASKKIA